MHGIWPTKNGQIGPLNCDHSKPFNPDYIEPILPDLRLHWTNVRANTDEDNFWKHEWNKHGTCAMVLEPMNNEFKYFSKGNENTILTNFNEKKSTDFSRETKVANSQTGHNRCVFTTFKFVNFVHFVQFCSILFHSFF